MENPCDKCLVKACCDIPEVFHRVVVEIRRYYIYGGTTPPDIYDYKSLISMQTNSNYCKEYERYILEKEGIK